MSLDPKSRDDLVRAADDTREKLLHAIVRLDRRGHEAAEAAKRSVGFFRKLQFGRAALAVASTCMTLLAVYEVAARSGHRQRRPSRWGLLKNVWHHPDRQLRVQRPFLLEVARSAMISLMASALAAPLRRVAARTAE